MTTTSFAAADPRTQKVWSKDMFEYAMQNIRLTPLMGKDRNSLIHVNKELTKAKGDVVTFSRRNPLTGAGVGDDGRTLTAEEALTRGNFSVTVHERAHSVISAGKISEQRTATNVRTEAKEDLGDWTAEALENDLVNCMAGLYNENSSGAAIQTINEAYPTFAATATPTLNRIYYGGQTVAGVLGTAYTTDATLTAGTQANNLMGTKVLSKIKRICMACEPKFRPIMVADEQSGISMGAYFLCLLHPLHIASIKAETGDAGFNAMVANAQIRGNKNPLFAGAAFLWDGIICWEYDRIPMRTGANGTTLAEGFLLNAGRTATDDACANTRSVARALFCGAQATCFGWAQTPAWYKSLEDGGRIPKVSTDMIYGVGRTNFNSHGTSTPTLEQAIYCIDTEVIVD